jgi:hypothetical protein
MSIVEVGFITAILLVTGTADETGNTSSNVIFYFNMSTQQALDNFKINLKLAWDCH